MPTQQPTEARWDFLKSNRFWALVIGALVHAAFVDGIISAAFHEAGLMIAGGFVGLRTLDRATEWLGLSQGKK